MNTTIESSERKPGRNVASKYNILYVDDEEVNLRVFKYAFQRHYNVLTALNGDHALEVIQDNEIHLIITDQRMPRMTGVDLLKKVVPKHPRIIRMIMTGFSDVGVLIDAVNDIGINKYLKKPWDQEDLKSTIDTELERSYGISTIKIESDGLVAEPDGERENLIFTQQKFLKNSEESGKILGDSFVVKYNENEITSDLHWVGRDKAGQKIIVSIDCHLNGNVAGSLTPAIYHLVDQLINQEDRIHPARLMIEIKNELLNQNFVTQINRYTQDDTNICVVAIDDIANNVSYASNYHAIQIFDLINAAMPEIAYSASFSTKEISRMIIFSNSCNGANLNGKSLRDLIADSVELNINEQHKLLRQQVMGFTHSKGLDDLTLIGLDFNNLQL